MWGGMWSGGWGWGWAPFSGLGWLFGLILIVALVRLVFFGRMWGWGPRSYRRWGGGGPFGGPYGGGAGYPDAEETLRQRLAKGEIDEAEYRRLLDILKR